MSGADVQRDGDLRGGTKGVGGRGGGPLSSQAGSWQLPDLIGDGRSTEDGAPRRGAIDARFSRPHLSGFQVTGSCPLAAVTGRAAVIGPGQNGPQITASTVAGLSSNYSGRPTIHRLVNNESNYFRWIGKL